LKLKIFALVLLLLSKTASAKIEAIIGSEPLDSNPNFAMLPHLEKDNEIIISRSQYLISYNKEKRSPNWVSWKLEMTDIGHVERKNGFIQDYYLQDYLKKNGNGATPVSASEFTGTCFNRGHQVPSKDRTDTEENNEKTFVTANIIPQTSFLNQIIWDQLEEYSRRLVRNGKKLFIIAGPVYDEDFGKIGPKKDIPVPSKNFKIIFVLNQNQSLADIDKNTERIAVMMPNVLSNGSKPTEGHACETSFSSRDKSLTTEKWDKYRVSLSEIEKTAGIEFRF
jgi:endonuclease G, mitochondrial